MKSRLLALSISLAATLGAAACNDPNENNVAQVVLADTLTVFALTGTSPSFPSGYQAATGAITRTDGNFDFDIAFDIDAANRVVVYPQRLVGLPLVGPKPVGIQRITVAFDSLQRAPSDGYVFDSSFVVAPGEGLVLQVQSPNECQLFLSTLLYTKLAVDSIDAARRAVYFHAVHDPNCGFRSLVAGVVPKN